jgi:hypothetical protein
MTSNGSGYTRATHDVEGQNDERLERLLGRVKILQDVSGGNVLQLKMHGQQSERGSGGDSSSSEGERD